MSIEKDKKIMESATQSKWTKVCSDSEFHGLMLDWEGSEWVYAEKEDEEYMTHFQPMRIRKYIELAVAAKTYFESMNPEAKTKWRDISMEKIAALEENEG